jgi:hypothetical protein
MTVTVLPQPHGKVRTVKESVVFKEGFGSMKWIHNKKRLTAYVLTALCIASTGFAATEHWNDASTTLSHISLSLS